MKKILLVLVVALLSVGSAMADNRPISSEQLPDKAKQFLKQHFPQQRVTLATQDHDLVGRDYEVTLDDGTRIDFSASGEWQKVESRGTVPSALVPAGVASYVHKHYANDKIVRIERDKRDFEVRLSNGLELTFDKYNRVTDIDD